MQRLVVNALFQEVMDRHNEKDGSRETQKLSRVHLQQQKMATKNGYEKCIYSMNNIHMSDEDNKHDTNHINKYNDANKDTRKLHL